MPLSNSISSFLLLPLPFSPETLSEAIKRLKIHYLVQAIDAHKMDQAIIFCRTKLDCDNAEDYLLSLGGGQYSSLDLVSILAQYCILAQYSHSCLLCILWYSGSKSMVNEYSCVCLHGDRRPQERKANLLAFKVRNYLNTPVIHSYIPVLEWRSSVPYLHRCCGPRHRH